MSALALEQQVLIAGSDCCLATLNKIKAMRRAYLIHKPVQLDCSTTIDNPEGERQLSPNIFHSVVESPSAIESEITQKHHVVGDLAFKARTIERLLQLPKISKSEVTQSAVSKCRSNAMSFISQSKRLSLSNSTAEEQRLVNRDHRNMLKHAYYQRQWRSRQSRQHNKKQSESAVPLFVEPNIDKETIAKENCKLFWEKSLRNHHKQLLRHLDDAPFQELELKSHLQTMDGTNKVERTIPKLELKRQQHGFYLRGRQRHVFVDAGSDDSPQRNFSVEEVLKSEWKKHGVSKLYNS